MNTIGVDSGLSGAFAVIDAAGDLVAIGDLPVMGEGAQRRIDAANLAHLVRAYLPATVAIEHVAARPGQGVSSMFRFGQAVGVIAGVAAALGTPIEWISPARWKKAAGLGSDKELSRLRAIDAWPQQARLFSRRKDHNRAEAALIAAWHRKHGRMSTGSDIGGVNG